MFHNDYPETFRLYLRIQCKNVNTEPEKKKELKIKAAVFTKLCLSQTYIAKIKEGIKISILYLQRV